MGHGHDAALVLLQEPLQPGHRLRVEVVRGLVEEQHVRGLQEQPAQGHAALLAARELGHVGVARRQAQRVHGDVQLAVHVPGVRGVDLVLHLRLLGDDLVHLRLGQVLAHLHGELFEAGDEGLLARHRLLDVLLHVLLRVEDGLLGEEADAGALGGEGLAREVLVEAGHDAEQGGLARPVVAEHADLGVAVEAQPDALQDLLALGGDLAQVLHGVDELGHGRILSPCRSGHSDTSSPALSRSDGGSLGGCAPRGGEHCRALRGYPVWARKRED